MAQQIKADRNYTLAAQIIQVADIFIKIREREMIPQNLSATAADVFFLVDAMGKGSTPVKISRMMMRERHSVATILVRKEKHGLIKRTKDMEDKHQIRITLTAKGKKALHEAMKKKGITNVMAKLTAEQRSKLAKALSILKIEGKKKLQLSATALPWP